MIAVNASVKILVVDAVIMVHAGGLAVAEDDRSQKLILIGLTPAVEDVAAECLVNRMALTLEEERIEN